MIFKDFPLIAVIWKDAHGSALSAYAPHEIPHKPMVMTTYGLRIRSDEEGVTVANEECGDGTYRGITFIPHGMVLEEIVLIPVKKQRKKTRKKKEAVVDTSLFLGTAQTPASDS